MTSNTTLGAEAAPVEPLLTATEVAELLRVSRQAVHRACQRGDLKPLRVFGHIRFEPAEVQRFLAEARRPRPASGVIPPPHPVPPIRRDQPPRVSFRALRQTTKEAQG